jgi:shikimate kinase
MTPVPRLRIALIGLMGSGKTRVGERLGETLGWPFFDTDRMVEETAGRSVSAIFAAETEAGFRRREAAALAVLGKRVPPLVAATGGGMVLRPENVTLLSASFYVIWLRVDAEEAWRRLETGAGRPLLAGEDPLDTLRRLERERNPLYAGTARLVLDAGPGRDPETLCRNALDALRALR